MNILLKLLTLPVTGPATGLSFIAKTIQNQIDEQQKELSPQARLLELESKLLLGEITDEEYQQEEELLLAKLDEQLLEDSGGNDGKVELESDLGLPDAVSRQTEDAFPDRRVDDPSGDSPDVRKKTILPRSP